MNCNLSYNEELLWRISNPWFIFIFCEIWDITKFGPGWDSNPHPTSFILHISYSPSHPHLHSIFLTRPHLSSIFLTHPHLSSIFLSHPHLSSIFLALTHLHLSSIFLALTHPNLSSIFLTHPHLSSSCIPHSPSFILHIPHSPSFILHIPHPRSSSVVLTCTHSHTLSLYFSVMHKQVLIFHGLGPCIGHEKWHIWHTPSTPIMCLQIAKHICSQ